MAGLCAVVVVYCLALMEGACGFGVLDNEVSIVYALVESLLRMFWLFW